MTKKDFLYPLTFSHVGDEMELIYLPDIQSVINYGTSDFYCTVDKIYDFGFECHIYFFDRKISSVILFKNCKISQS